MSLQGDLEFRDANKITFIGGSSNTLIDLTTGSLGVGVTGTSLSSNLHVAGNKIKVGDNIFSTDGPHARLPKTVPLKKYPEIAFEEGKFDYNDSTNTYVQAGYTVTASDQNNGSSRYVWQLFDNLDGSVWGTSGGSFLSGQPGIASSTGDEITLADNTTHTRGHWAKIKFPNKIIISTYTLNSTSADRRPQSISILGSNNDTDWYIIKDVHTVGSQDEYSISVNATTAYKYIMFMVHSIVGSDNQMTIGDLKFYGYEEDPPAGDTSVDTTFKSVMNTPQTTGANVYVDAKLSSDFTNQVTGPTPVGTAATHDNTNKYWELTGELTSNITVEANTFLEGDQPHAVSVWFNSSNLEANVSNTCVFSISDQEKLDSVNLDLQSNTWHNLTYAYQGEGGSRVTYLDGRKVSEDQAEDTFGEYPPFAMTGHSQGGYVASASTEYTTYSAWNGFDEIQSAIGIQNHWSGSLQKYNTSDGDWSGDTTSIYTTNVEGVNKYGEWLQIEFPHKIKYNYSKIKAPYNHAERQPRDGYIVGSNDLSGQWTTLHRFTGVTRSSGTETVTYTPPSAPTNAFKYIRLVIEAMTASVGQYAGVDEWDIYGHRENDLVRLPDPTNVLKYPHIQFPIGPNSNEPTGIRGYVASASSSSNSGIGRRPWGAFNDLGEGKANLGGLWQNQEDGANHKYTPQTTGLATTNAALFEGVYGEWIKLELPHKIKVSQVYILTSGAHEGVEKAILYGSNDDINWDVIKDSGTAGVGFTFTLTTNGGLKEATESVTTSNYYKYLLLQVTEVVVGSGTSDGRSLQLYKLQYFGTEEATPVPIQIGGGNIDKVANFRVYDKFIGEDQALEIWDAQKDEFDRAKSSMTLHKGRLGIGTTEPEGSLAVLDEPYNLEEFPPRAMTGYKNHFEGHGEFCVNGSGAFDNNLGSIYYEWHVFDHKHEHAGEGPSSAWYTLNGTYYNGVDNSYSGTSQLASGVPLGDFVKLELPYRVNVRKFVLTGPNTESEFPRDFTFYGSNDNNTWNSLLSVTGAVIGTNSPNHRSGVENTLKYAINSSTFYKYYAIVITKGNSYRNTYVGIGEWRLFGTREQGQSVLHDGQLTLTKNLDVPRIGPDLDADDTPRRDRLVVEYNTSTNPTFEGAVRDTSGRGNDGILLDGAYYNATEKSLDLSAYDGNLPSGSQTAHIKSGILPGFTGNQAHTVSFWYKGGSDIDGYWVVIAPQTGEGTNKVSSILYEPANNRFNLVGWSNDFFVNYTAASYRWYHIVVTYNGTTVTTTNKKMYIDGVLQTNTASNTEGAAMAFPDNMIVCLAEKSAGSGETNPEISNFKLYDTALTAAEVKTLYDMGRCDEGHHVVNFSKTRVGIGLGDGGTPHDELDVRGNVRGSDNVIIGPYGGQWWRLYTFQHNGNLGFLGEDGTEHGYLADSGTVSNIDFTGQHRSIIDKINVSDYESLEGLIVSANKNKYINVDKDITTGSNAIQISQSLPVVSLSNVVHDKACYGVISGSEDPESRTYEQGTFVSVFQKQKGDTRAFINSVGEGAIWVVNTNGSLESGDYITTSNVAGYGQKQDDDILHNYTVAKITMDCDFEPATQPVQVIKKDEEGENILDEHGQIQWEDHPTETEKAYKVRYLTTDGIQTDEANAVHIAAFVGCTYHCG